LVSFENFIKMFRHNKFFPLVMGLIKHVGLCSYSLKLKNGLKALISACKFFRIEFHEDKL